MIALAAGSFAGHPARARAGAPPGAAQPLRIAPAAPKPDLAAPRGASSDWLPDEPWVLDRWLPYSEPRLFSLLRTDVPEVRAWLLGGRRDLADLARRKGLRPGRIVDALVAPWRARVSPARFAVLRAHARRTFTQRHLMQHMLFHTFHIQTLQAATPGIIGTSWTEIIGRLNAGRSFLDVARAHGHPAGHVTRAFRRILGRNADRGVRARLVSRAQADRWKHAELELMGSYYGYRRPVRAAAATAAVGHALLCPVGGRAVAPPAAVRPTWWP